MDIRHKDDDRLLLVVESDTLVNANLEDANLEDANLWGANLEDANLEDANLRRANLEDANLRRANLGGANLGGANLEGANLEGANLWGANLWGANLRGANLEGANLEGANLGGANLGHTCLIDGGQRSDKYRFVGWIKDDDLMIRAGCRNFTLSEAREHWSRTRGGSPLGDETFIILDHIERVVRIRRLMS